MQSRLHGKRKGGNKRWAGRASGLSAAVGLALPAAPLWAQHEGHQMPGGTSAAGVMPGHAAPSPLLSWMPILFWIALGGAVLWAIAQTRRGKRPVWLNKQVVWGTAIMLVVFAGTSTAVKKLKRPGQMTVIEAQAMDMTVMKAPVGTAPVVVEKVQRGPFEARASYTGTVVAFTDEDVYPRVTGWIREMPVYAGDRVKAGQLVARLDSAELGSKANEAAFARLSAEQMRAQMQAEEAQAQATQAQAASEQVYARGGVEEADREAAASRGMITEAQRNLAGARAMARQTEKEITAAQSAVRSARSEVEGARESKAQAEASLANAHAEVASMEADVSAVKARLSQVREQIKRSEALYKKGAVSLEELQRDQADAAAAEAAVTAAEAKVRQSKSGVATAEAGVRQSDAMVRSAEARVDQMQADADATSARLEQARANVDAVQAKVEQTQATAGAAQARVTQMRAMLDRSGASVRSAAAGANAASRKRASATATAGQMQAAQTTASVIKGYAEIRALTDGVVTQRVVSPGVLVNPGTAILKIAQIDRVRLQANVAEQDVASIRVGSPVRVKSMKDPGRVVATKVTSIFPAADPAARTVIVEAITPNADHRLVPGQYLSMEITTQRIEDAVTVPNRALVEVAPAQTGVFFTEKEKAVWVVRTRESKGPTEYYCTMHPEVVQGEPGTCPKCLMKLEPRTKSGNRFAEQVRVTPGASDGTRTVIAAGLNEGDEVIVGGNRNLREGDAVGVQGSGFGVQEADVAPGLGTTPPGAQTAASGSEPRTLSPEPLYTCPMHPEVLSEKPGTCAKCNMKLEKSKTPGAVRTLYTCPMHPEVVSNEPGQCPACNMKLEKAR